MKSSLDDVICHQERRYLRRRTIKKSESICEKDNKRINSYANNATTNSKVNKNTSLNLDNYLAINNDISVNESLPEEILKNHKNSYRILLDTCKSFRGNTKIISKNLTSFSMPAFAVGSSSSHSFLNNNSSSSNNNNSSYNYNNNSNAPSLSSASEEIFKILLIGNSGVGKTSILTRFVDNDFPKTHISTIGVDFKIKRFNLASSNRSVKLQIWDTAGQERFQTITNSYYRGTQGVVLIYDVTDRQSFEDIRHRWHEKLANFVENKSVYMLLGNKLDRTSDITGNSKVVDDNNSEGDAVNDLRQVRYDEGQDLATNLNALFFEVSAMQDDLDEKHRVKHAMYCLTDHIVNNFSNDHADNGGNNDVDYYYLNNLNSSRQNLVKGGMRRSTIYSGRILNENNEDVTCCGLNFGSYFIT